VLREGLRLIEERERIEQAKLEALKQAARQGCTGISNQVMVWRGWDMTGLLAGRVVEARDAARGLLTTALVRLANAGSLRASAAAVRA